MLLPAAAGIYIDPVLLYIIYNYIQYFLRVLAVGGYIHKSDGLWFSDFPTVTQNTQLEKFPTIQS